MPSDKKTQQEYRKRLVQERRDQSLCLQCGERVNSGQSRCEVCKEKAKISRAKGRTKRKAAGICQNSGCPNKAMPGKTVCKTCSRQASKSASRRYRENKVKGVCRYCGAESDGKARCGDCAAYFEVYQQAWYKERRDAGLCVNCGKQKAVEGIVFCQTCRENKQRVAKIRWQKLKLDCLNAYGATCIGCSEAAVEILEIDHVVGGGNEHRKVIGQSNIYLWLKQQGYPPGYRVLCPTCNKKAHAGLPLPTET